MGGIPAWLKDQLPSAQFLKAKKAAVLVMSDRAARGEYADESGACLKELLADAGAEITAYEVVPDHKDNIAQVIVDICKSSQPDVLLASGGSRLHQTGTDAGFPSPTRASGYRSCRNLWNTALSNR